MSAIDQLLTFTRCPPTKQRAAGHSRFVATCVAVKDLKNSARHSIVWLALTGIICGIFSFLFFYVTLSALITGEIVPNMNSLAEGRFMVIGLLFMLIASALAAKVPGFGQHPMNSNVEGHLP